MCGRYSFFTDDELYDRFKAVKGDWELQEHYNVAPGMTMPIIVNTDQRHVVPMRWGLIPSWAKEEKAGYKMINARSETLAEKPTFKKLLVHNRCLVPANGFFEWKKQDGPKQPYYIHLKNEPLFAFAGLYSEWKNPETGQELSTYTIVTTEAEGPMADIHHRMPIILDRKFEDEWLNPDISEAEEAMKQLQQAPLDKWDIYPISTAVNSPKNDSAALIGRIAQ